MKNQKNNWLIFGGQDLKAACKLMEEKRKKYIKPEVIRIPVDLGR